MYITTKYIVIDLIYH